jgi:hypothetical protein
MTPEEEDLIEHIFDHLCEEQPEVIADLKDKEILRRIGIGVERAHARGIVHPEAVTAFVSLMFLVSPRFDEQPAISAALNDPGVPEKQRLATLFQKTKEADWDDAALLGNHWPK